MRAIIVGGGIGGLTAALCLRRRGWRVHVLERADEIREVGAGVQIAPNGMRILDALGVSPRLSRAVFEPEGIEVRHGGTGWRTLFMPLGEVARSRWGAAYVQIYRPDLVAALRDALLDDDGATLTTGAGVTGYRLLPGGGAAALLGAGGEEAGDLLVGADGLHSGIRRQMLGDTPARFTGHVAWRCVVPAERLGTHQPPPTGCVWTGAGRHVVTTRMRGGALVNLVGIHEEKEWTQEGWRLPGDRDGALDLFGWNPVLRAILGRTDEIFRWALFDRPPLPRWSDGAAVLLGDAAHPMLPSLAQGAVQAMEDGVALAEAVTGARAGGDMAAAGRAYYEARIGRASRVQANSAANLRLFHQRSIAAQAARYGPMWLAGRLTPGLLLRRYDWLFGGGPQVSAEAVEKGA